MLAMLRRCPIRFGRRGRLFPRGRFGRLRRRRRSTLGWRRRMRSRSACSLTRLGRWSWSEGNIYSITSSGLRSLAAAGGQSWQLFGCLRGSSRARFTLFCTFSASRELLNWVGLTCPAVRFHLNLYSVRCVRRKVRNLARRRLDGCNDLHGLITSSD